MASVDKTVLAFSLLVAGVFTGFATQELNNPNLIYQALGAALLAVSFTCWNKRGRPIYLVILGMTWYILYWAVRDAILGFYAPQTLFDDSVALFPAVLALTYMAWPNLKTLWWKLLLVSIIHIILCYFMRDTDNELISLLVLVVLSTKYSFDERAFLLTLYWYQTYIASTKYMILTYPDRDIIYFVALTPLLASTLYILIRRTIRGR